jgi:hypothetical protein
MADTSEIGAAALSLLMQLRAQGVSPHDASKLGYVMHRAADYSIRQLDKGEELAQYERELEELKEKADATSSLTTLMETMKEGRAVFVPLKQEEEPS